MATNKRPACKYGEKCYRKNPDHLRNFWHPSPDKKESEEGPNVVDDKDKVKAPGPADLDACSNASDSELQEIEERESASSDSQERPLKKRKTGDDLPQISTFDTAENKTETKENENENDPLTEEDQPSSPENVKESIKTKCLFEMSDDFYQFWDFCSSLNASDPQNALKCLKLKLVGPFDVLGGKHKNVRKNKHGRRPNFALHYRYYYDPPEFQTVVASTDSDCFHIGYFRDDPSEDPVFVASNTPTSPTSKEKIVPCGENLFAAVYIYASKMLKTATPFAKTPIQKLIKSLESQCAKLDLDLSVSTKGMKARQKKVVCPSLHGAGIVVPVDENEIGYRPVPESISDLKLMFKRIADAKSDKDRERHMEDLQELITLVQFANDECDYGEGLELGIDLFSYGGEIFHPQIAVLLPLAYQLLNRSQFLTIINAHLDNRRQIGECVDELL